MKKIFKLWSGIIGSPSKGFAELSGSSPVVLPLIMVLVLTALSIIMIMPIMSSDAYIDAMSRVQINTLSERGTELTDEQIDAMNQQMNSASMRTITLISSIGGGLVSFAVILLVQTLILMLLTRIVKDKASFKHLFRLIIFLALISVVQGIVKNGITLFSNYERLLSKVQTTADLQWAITSPVSLAVLFSPTKLNPSVYTLIDYCTDIFNWIYYVYLFFGLRFSAGLAKNKALTVTVISAVLMLVVSLAMTLFL